MIKKTFPIVGMHCASCKTLIEDVVGELTGVKNVMVNYATEKMTVEYDEDKVNIEKLKKAVASAGTYQMVYTPSGTTVLASPPEVEKMSMEHHNMHHDEENSDQHDHGIPLDEKLRNELYNNLKRRVTLMGLGAIPFLIYMFWMAFGMKFGLPELSKILPNVNFLQFLLATPILFIGGKDVFVSAWTAAKIKASNMDTLIALGTGTAWAYSTIVTFFPLTFSSALEGGNEVYFEASVFIIFFILLGRLLEMRAKGQAAQAIKALLHLQAKEAIVIRKGKEIRIPVEFVMVGDTVVVKPGQKFPVDGTIVEGSTEIDESMVTGESIPVYKQKGDAVIGATINKSGFIKYRATKVGADTLLSQIIRMVEEAQATEAPIQRLADRVSSVFVPAVIIIATLAFAFWFTTSIPFATYIAITVLIIACPCALGLATPTAVLVGTGKAARHGILIKDAEALEIAHKINVIVFDKTGTLTKGKPEVVDYEPRDKTISSLLYSIERRSHHPLAEAVVSYFEDSTSLTPSSRRESRGGVKELEVSSFKDHPGLGIEAKINNKHILVGTEKFLRENEINISGDFDKKINDLRHSGKTVSLVVVDKAVLAVVGIADTVKEDAKETLSKLHDMGIKTMMITGDNKITAQAVAQELGIDEVLAEVMPADKSKKIKELQNIRHSELVSESKRSRNEFGMTFSNKRQIVAMVGDGINDAPALAQADVGIAMGTGTDVAIATGDIVLVKGTLEKVVQTIKLSRQTLAIIKQNLFWAFGYNIIGIPIAAGLLYPGFGLLLSPIIASVAMALSSVSVVGNSLRLKYQ